MLLEHLAKEEVELREGHVLLGAVLGNARAHFLEVDNEGLVLVEALEGGEEAAELGQHFCAQGQCGCVGLLLLQQGGAVGLQGAEDEPLEITVGHQPVAVQVHRLEVLVQLCLCFDDGVHGLQDVLELLFVDEWRIEYLEALLGAPQLRLNLGVHLIQLWNK